MSDIYMDNNATTMVDPEVVEAICFLRGHVGDLGCRWSFIVCVWRARLRPGLVELEGRLLYALLQSKVEDIFVLNTLMAASRAVPAQMPMCVVLAFRFFCDIPTFLRSHGGLNGGCWILSIR